MVGQPSVTAIQASIAGPIWPAVSIADMYHRLRKPSALRTSVTVAPENPGRARRVQGSSPLRQRRRRSARRPRWPW
ncbi:hypothetical protein I553_4955 [Mycobacterium xenopi 4042]|uniref:Uncharacterized protein n=1 Tax=Mycobacterium xenopi 4042 TaxID=1299334 RepID=X8AI33_MYCXE|nr:hypothetical protein I553_4955 [Mycobacterium xenopi 4042]